MDSRSIDVLNPPSNTMELLSHFMFFTAENLAVAWIFITDPYTDITVTCTMTVDIGLFGSFGSFPVVLTAKASGKSEVYYK